MNPQSLDLSSLPWLPLEARSAFPCQPAIYFAIDSQNNIQYIGRSTNPKARWEKHHRYGQLAELGGVRIAYLFIDSPDLLAEIEDALIAWFDPPLNVIKPGWQAERSAPVKDHSSPTMHCNLAVLIASRRPRVSQRELSAATKLSTHTISQLYQDKVKRVDYSTVEKLCSYFDCGISDLFVLEEVNTDD